MYEVNCKNCSTELSFGTIKRLEDLDFANMGYYCNECFSQVESELKEARFVEEYKGNQIYCKDGKYSPYWHSRYHFLSLEDAKKRIDNKHLVCVDVGAMKTLNTLLR